MVEKQLGREEVIALFARMNQGLVYKKKGIYFARPTVPNEVVMTIVDGKVETYKVTGIGEWVIINMTVGSTAERYCIAPKRYKDRYTPTGKAFVMDGFSWLEVEAKGMVEGRFYEDTQTLAFLAPWGEDMLLETGDFLARPFPNDDPNDIYRIARAEFNATYGEEPIGTASELMAQLKETEPA